MSTLIQPLPIPVVARGLARAAPTFDAHSAVFESVGERLRGRLELLAIEPRRVLDLGCRSGYQLDALAARYPDAEIVGCDPAPAAVGAASGAAGPVGAGPAARAATASGPDRSATAASVVPDGATAFPSFLPAWLRRLSSGGRTGEREEARPPARVGADPHRLPFADGAFDLVVSNLLLPWCHAPHAVFGEVARVLGAGGAFLFTSAGPDTLREYRAVWAGIDAHLHGFGLIDMHDLGDAMLGAGFAAPVLDRDEIRVDYPSIDALQDELRRVGAGNVATGRRAGLMAPTVRKALRDGTDGEGRFPVTLELVQGHAWKGELATPVRGPEGEQYVSVDTLRGSLGRSRDG